MPEITKGAQAEWEQDEGRGLGSRKSSSIRLAACLRAPILIVARANQKSDAQLTHTLTHMQQAAAMPSHRIPPACSSIID